MLNGQQMNGVSVEISIVSKIGLNGLTMCKVSTVSGGPCDFVTQISRLEESFSMNYRAELSKIIQSALDWQIS